jgi:hypothetical protein
VRFIDAFVDGLDLAAPVLQFGGMPAAILLGGEIVNEQPPAALVSFVAEQVNVRPEAIGR